MPRVDATRRSVGREVRSKMRSKAKPEARFTVSLPSITVKQVEQYAESMDISFSKAVGALVRLGLENQENRKREFFQKLRKNLHNDNPEHEDRLIDEFRDLILGRS